MKTSTEQLPEFRARINRAVQLEDAGMVAAETSENWYFSETFIFGVINGSWPRGKTKIRVIEEVEKLEPDPSTAFSQHGRFVFFTIVKSVLEHPGSRDFCILALRSFALSGLPSQT